MNILVFCQYYYPEQFLINEITEELVKRENSVTVVTGLPNYPSGIIPEDYKKGKKRKEVINGVNVIRTSIIPRGKSVAQLLMNYVSYMVLANSKAKKLKGYDVVFLYQMTPITQAYPAIKYCKKNNIRLFMYNCDLAPMAGDRLASKSAIFYKAYARFSKWAINSADLIGVASKSFIEYNNRINEAPIEKMVYVPQHASSLMLNMDVSSKDNNISDFMFAGNLGGGASLETILKAARIIIDNGITNFKIHFVGDGSYLPELKRLVSTLDIGSNVVFHGRRKMNEMPEMYMLADALLITLRKGQITVPTKLQTYMTTGKPIFGAMDGSGAEIIKESECGDCTPAEDSAGLARIMQSYIENPPKYAHCGEKAKDFFRENFTKDKYMESLVSLLEKCSRGDVCE